MFGLGFGEIGSNKNSFRCPYCREITNHIRVGIAETETAKNSKILRYIARVQDEVGVTKLCDALFDCKFWKCTKCTNVIKRDSSGNINDIEFPGYGWKEYPLGIYHGCFDNLQNVNRHGTGRFLYNNGDTYDGEWHDDKRHGKGSLTLADGTIYDGQWEHNKMNGIIIVTKTEGNMRSGIWHNGVFDHWL